MSYVLAILLSLIAAGILAWIVAMLAGDADPRPAADVAPLALPPARPLSAVAGAHAAAHGRARVGYPGGTIDPPAARPYVSRHHEDTVDVGSLYRPAFAARVGIDPVTARPGRGSHR